MVRYSSDSLIYTACPTLSSSEVVFIDVIVTLPSIDSPQLQTWLQQWHISTQSRVISFGSFVFLEWIYKLIFLLFVATRSPPSMIYGIWRRTHFWFLLFYPNPHETISRILPFFTMLQYLNRYSITKCPKSTDSSSTHPSSRLPSVTSK